MAQVDPPHPLVNTIRSVANGVEKLLPPESSALFSEIAGRLRASIHAVKGHVRNIMEKLALHSRLQITAYSEDPDTSEWNRARSSLVKVLRFRLWVPFIGGSGPSGQFPPVDV